MGEACRLLRRISQLGYAIARMADQDIDALLSDKWAGRIMRSRPKLEAIIHNARICVEIEASHPGGFAGFLWSFVDGRPETINTELSNESERFQSVFGKTSRFSDAMERVMLRSKYKTAANDFKYLGSVTLQAFALQVGLLNGHSPRCPKNPHCGAAAPAAAPAAAAARSSRKRGRSTRTGEAQGYSSNDRARGVSKRRAPRRRVSS